MGSHTLSVAFMKVWFCRHKRADMRTDTDKDAWPYCVLTEKLNLILAHKCGCLIEPLGFCTHICWQSLSSDVATPVHHGGCVVWAWGIFLMKHQRSVVSLEAVTSCIFWFWTYILFLSVPAALDLRCQWMGWKYVTSCGYAWKWLFGFCQIITVLHRLNGC